MHEQISEDSKVVERSSAENTIKQAIEAVDKFEIRRHHLISDFVAAGAQVLSREQNTKAVVDALRSAAEVIADAIKHSNK